MLCTTSSIFLKAITDTPDFQKNHTRFDERTSSSFSSLKDKMLQGSIGGPFLLKSHAYVSVQLRD